MRQFSFWLVLLVLVPGLGVADSLQAVGKTVDDFHAAASRADQDTYLGLLTGEAVFLGTDGTERWQGKAFRVFVESHFSKGQGWTYISTERHVTISASGDSAWFDEMLAHDSLGVCRGSGALQRTADGWRIAQYNLSVPIPNSMVGEVAEQIIALGARKPALSTGQVFPAP